MSIHSRITAPSEAEQLATYAFETYVPRGPDDREYPVDVEYRITAAGEVELTRWAIEDGTYPLTSYELDLLQEDAENHAVKHGLLGGNSIRKAA